MVRRIAWVVLASVGFGSHAFGAPPAIALLKRAVATHQKLGPVTVKTHFTMKQPNQLIEATIVSQQNDASHFYAAASMHMGTLSMKDGFRWYSNGPATFYYNGLENKYNRSLAASDFPPDMMGTLLDEMNKSLKDAPNVDEGTPVKPETMDGVPGYRIVLPKDPSKPGDAAGFLVVGKADGLVRRFHMVDPTQTIDITASYVKAPKPFPVATFVFNPPAGATETVDTPKDAAKTDDSK